MRHDAPSLPHLTMHRLLKYVEEMQQPTLMSLELAQSKGRTVLR